MGFSTIFAAVLCFAHLASAQKSVLGVLFVEKDRTHTRQMRRAVVTQLKKVQKSYLDNFGATFRLANPPVKVIKADQNAAWYWQTRSRPGNGNTNNQRWFRLENIKDEIVRKLGLGGNTRVVVYPTTKSDGKVGAYKNTAAGTGAYMDFDDLTCVYGGGESTPFGPPQPYAESVCGAHEMHELGHIFGLEHAGPNEDCMRQGFYKNAVPRNTLCTFSKPNRQTVKSADVGNWLSVKKINGKGPRRTCNWNDACDKHEILGFEGDFIRDTCGSVYKVSRSCGLTRV